MAKQNTPNLADRTNSRNLILNLTKIRLRNRHTILQSNDR
jgi:hypothetical protein